MKVDEMLKKLQPIWGDYTKQVWQEYLVADAEIRKIIEASLHIAMARHLDRTFDDEHILLEPPPKDRLAGDYPLGTVFYGEKSVGSLHVREQEWIQHVGIFGRSGSGKTHTAFIILWNFLKKNKPFWVLDWKRNYRDLLATSAGARIQVFTVGRSVAPFHFNPLIPPPSVPATIWLKKLIEIMAHAYFLGEGVSYLLQEAFDGVYRQFRVYDGRPERWPTLADVRDALRKHRATGREAAWMDSALRAVGVLCFGEMDRVLNQGEPIPLDALLKRSVIFELDALTNSDKVFLIESLLLWVHHYRMGEGQRETFKHAIIIEEAHHILLGKKQEIVGTETITDVILREIRELGEAIILLDQHPSLISKPALGNTYLTIGMNLKHRSDVNMMADAMLLDTETARYLGRLEVGEAIVKLQGRWTQPFLVHFPNVDIRKGVVTDDDIRTRSQGSGGQSAPIRSSEGQSSPDAAKAPPSRPGRETGKGWMDGRMEGSRAGWSEGRSDGERALMADVRDKPGSGVKERYRRLGLSTYQGNRLKGRLREQGLIEEREVRTRTGRVMLLLLTDRGRAILDGRAGAETKRTGGPEHRFWMERVAERFRREGYEVEAEVPIGGGKTTDLVARKEGKRIAIEVETGQSEVVVNIRKNLEYGFDAVLVLATSEEALKKVRREMKVAGLEGHPQVEVGLVQEMG